MNTAPIAEDDDRLWRALANPVRRRILDVLRDGPRTTGEVVDALGQAGPRVQADGSAPVREGPGRHVVVQHLAVLREADLVRVEPQGRRRVNHLNPVPIQQILQRWVSRYEANWVAALVGLKDTVEHPREARERKGEDVG